MKQELIQIVRDKSFQYSPEPVFKLVSGRMSQYYINCKPTTLSPRGMYLAGHLIYDAVRDCNVRGIGGLTFGADPIAMAVAYTSELKKNPIKAFSIRKTQKDHGIVKWIEGDLNPGDRVAVIDDVVTTGGSTIKAIERARAEGMEVVKVVILVDRREGGLENVQEQVADVEAIITVQDLQV